VAVRPDDSHQRADDFGNDAKPKKLTDYNGMPTKLIRGFLFRCRHQFTWPRSDDMGKNYQVCVHCGAMYSYDWSTMRRVARLTGDETESGVRRGARLKCGSRKNWVPRPRRLRHQVPLQIRLAGKEEWMEGDSENVTRAGLLLSCATPLEMGASVEVMMVMPQEITGDKSAQVLCEATVLRVEVPPAGRSGKQSLFRIACAIKDYKFVPEAG
jgi:hypothetical protein